MATLETAATALKSANAASETAADRAERSWKNRFVDTGDGGGAQLLCSRSDDGANEASFLVASTADLSTDDKINEGMRILKYLLTPAKPIPNINFDADDVHLLRRMLDWGVALVGIDPPPKATSRKNKWEQH